MGVVGTVVAFIVLIVVLVLVHELGHFVAAKLAGITVEEFSVGFPPRVTSRTWHGTRYSIGATPLGGYVRMLGEDGEIEADRLREQGLTEDEVAHAMAGAFNRKPIPIRVAVLVAGVAMNFLLAAVLFAVVAGLPTPDLVGPLTVTSIQAGSPAEGTLQAGDRILAADGMTFGDATGDFHDSRDMTTYVTSRAGEPVTLTVERGSQTISVVVTPRSLTQDQLNAGMGPVGFTWTAATVMVAPLASNPVEAVALGAEQTAQIAVQIPGALGQTVAALVGLAPNTGEARGPIGIAQVTGQVLQEPVVSQLFFVGLLSVNLAVLNVLPFPPLDGGRILVVLIEAVRRRRLPAEREALIYLTGFLVLIALVILISIQDIARLPGT
jgi:regulator of sigma E protease